MFLYPRHDWNSKFAVGRLRRRHFFSPIISRLSLFLGFIWDSSRLDNVLSLISVGLPEDSKNVTLGPPLITVDSLDNEIVQIEEREKERVSFFLLY